MLSVGIKGSYNTILYFGENVFINHLCTNIYIIKRKTRKKEKYKLQEY